MQHKETGRLKWNWIYSLVNKLRLGEASRAAKLLMFARQQMFDYRDKPNKFLAQVLA